MFHLFSFTIIIIILIYTIESATIEKFITGKVTHAGSNTIDKNSQVKVELRDVSLMDAPSKLIASTTITSAKTFPISYKLTYNPSDITPNHHYAISATINGPDNKLLFINDVRIRVDFTNSAFPTIDVAVIRIGGSSDTDTKKSGHKKECGPVKCPGNKPKQCAYGYQKTLDGCEICKCNDPCNPPGKAKLCGPKQRCFIEKKPDGTFEGRCGTSSSKHPDRNKHEKHVSNIACKQPKDAGNCKARMPRFYYNSATKNCESFTYGGCQGNKNNFLTKAECENACKA
ncbi:unnamed protein product [Rotaria sp. Silwood1]|nr:unnamed protein product [Rotaria sp. Silwood1]CAF4609289.1 unnamed protein product [Rotaria sp. Silwood1]